MTTHRANRRAIPYFERIVILEAWVRCAYCNDVVHQGAEHIDHIHPVSRGGADVIENLALACIPCNLAKHNRTAAEFGYPDVPARALAVVERCLAILSTSIDDRDLTDPLARTLTNRVVVEGLRWPWTR